MFIPFLSFPFRHPVRASMKGREGPKQEGSFIIANLTDLKKSKPASASLLSAAGLPSPLSAPSVEQQVGMLLGTGRSCPGVGGGCVCCLSNRR